MVPMSNDDGLRIWVSDIDDYIDLDAIQAENDQEAKDAALERELCEIGEIALLAGKAISAWHLHEKGISPSDWRHAMHQARMTIGPAATGTFTDTSQISSDAQVNVGERCIRAMLDLGRSYAIARYARFECLDYSSAITATLPHGIRALLHHFLATERIQRSSVVNERLRLALTAKKGDSMTAYRRTAILQTVLHNIADESPNHKGGLALDRDRTRVILALARLYFSALELRASTQQDLATLISLYNADRETLGHSRSRLTRNGRSIERWRLRHIRSLLDFYPYSIRHGLMRIITSKEAEKEAEAEAFVNELALAHCSILRMRLAGRNRNSSCL